MKKVWIKLVFALIVLCQGAKSYELSDYIYRKGVNDGYQQALWTVGSGAVCLTSGALYLVANDGPDLDTVRYVASKLTAISGIISFVFVLGTILGKPAYRQNVEYYFSQRKGVLSKVWNAVSTVFAAGAD